MGVSLYVDDMQKKWILNSFSVVSGPKLSTIDQKWQKMGYVDCLCIVEFYPFLIFFSKMKTIKWFTYGKLSKWFFSLNSFMGFPKNEVLHQIIV